MPPLTQQVWERRHADLRPRITERWPAVDGPSVEAVGDDFDGLVALVRQVTGLSADRARAEIGKLDVDEPGSGADPGDGRASLAQLRLGRGFTDAERDRVVDRLSQLDRHLRRFPADGTSLELVVKDRDTPSQVVTLELWVPNYPRFVASSKEHDLRDALADIRHDLIRQIDDAVGKRTGGGR